MEDRMGAISSGIFRRQQNDELCAASVHKQRSPFVSSLLYLSVVYVWASRFWFFAQFQSTVSMTLIFCSLST
jgi:hypothetical protein